MSLQLSFLEVLFGRNAQTIVLENLIRKKGEFAYLSGIADETGLSYSSVARVIEPLLKTNMIIEKKLGRQMRTFAINEKEPKAKLVVKFYYDLLTLKN